jgi:hypothetical protein
MGDARVHRLLQHGASAPGHRPADPGLIPCAHRLLVQSGTARSSVAFFTITTVRPPRLPPRQGFLTLYLIASLIVRRFYLAAPVELAVY